MKTNDKSLYTVKGIHKYEGKKDEPVPQLFINDDGQIIVIKNHNQEVIWMWTMQKDFKYSMIQAEAKKPAIRQRISAITELENAQAEEKEI